MVYYMSFRGASSRRVPVLPNYVATGARVHFHLDSQNGVKYVDSGAMCHPTCPTLQKYQTTMITPHSVSSVNLSAMMSIVVAPSS
jgi:hypothetical protein